MIKDDALKLAIEALEDAKTTNDSIYKWERISKAINACKAALETKEQLFGNSEEFKNEESNNGNS